MHKNKAEIFINKANKKKLEIHIRNLLYISEKAEVW